ncbi:MAG: molybdopterin-dependent oxidoreductase [Planctomycetota bacterium]
MLETHKSESTMELRNSDAAEVSASIVARDELRRRTRRSMTTGAAAAAVGAVGLWWIKSAAEGHSWPLRRTLEFNERIAKAYFSPERLALTLIPPAPMEPRVNGMLGLRSPLDIGAWRLDVASGDEIPILERSLTMAAIQTLPRYQMVTEFKCVEGWSQIVQWAGARLSDFLNRFGRETPYVALATPDRQYYVGIDRQSALHSQSLLAYEMNGAPLTTGHGAPLRLVCPLKYGVKSIKRIGMIHCTNRRPADYWAERGYDWYLGH